MSADVIPDTAPVTGEELPPGAAPGKVLPPAALRALAEAQARRDAAPQQALAPESGGPSGPEPTRYGDWERGGIASDF